MTDISIDEIINKLSSKFKRIFYDREFVGSVGEDLRTIIKNENKCCVLVFPVLSPNYLRVVRYQAKLFDLAIFTLGRGCAKSVGVCHKKYFLSSVGPEENSKPEKSCSNQMAENSANSTKKKRPPIQLYVPPAQRSCRLSERRHNSQKISSRSDGDKLRGLSVIAGNNDIKKDRCIEADIAEKDARASERLLLRTTSSEAEKDELQNKDFCLCMEDIDYLLPNETFIFPFFSYQCKCMKFLLFKNVFPYAKLLLFRTKRIHNSLHCIKLKQNTSIITEDNSYLEKSSFVNIQRLLFRNVRKDLRVGVFGPNVLDFRETSHFSKEYNDFQNTYYLCGDILLHLPQNNYYCYRSVPQYEVFDHDLKPQDYLHGCQNNENESTLEDFINSVTNCIILPQLLKTKDLDLNSFLYLPSRTKSPEMPYEKDEVKCDNKTDILVCAKLDYINKMKNNNSEEKKNYRQIDRVIVLDDPVPAKIGSQSPPRIKGKDQHNDHEQEKEIMRKAKQNINRKTRPIIKYVDDDNDTLRIGKSDNVNNWEDLFNDDGELQEDIFTEIIQKVGPEVTVVKATEDYSAYASKQIEELEHMVELYDFPATLETHDIISAFSMLKSDSMYVKWVDDTRALLVLGSSIQAQKAIELSNPLIKVRPMSAASNLALEKAHQSDLKPAMKRPQTNLQTARRLITSHLGAKSRVSKEQSAKEREDLRVAKEMKKQAKQNEKDAWEGNLRSTIN